MEENTYLLPTKEADPTPASGVTPSLVIIALACVFVSLCSGTLYVFGLFAPDLKTLLGFTQEEINLMFSFVYVGSSFLVPIVSLWGAQLGPLKVMAGFSVLCAVIWCLIVLSVQGHIAYNAAAFCFYFMVIGLSLGSYFVLIVIWAVGNIPSRWMVGFQSTLVAAYGVGGAICTVAYMYGFEEAVNGLASFFILLSVLYSVPSFVTSGLMGIFRKRAPADAGSVQGTDIVEVSERVSIPRLALHNITSLRFWWLALSIFISCAVGSAIQANLGNLLLSLQGDPHLISGLEIIFAVAQAVGRVVPAILHTIRTPFPRVIMLPIPFVLMVVGCALYLVPVPLTTLPYLVGLIAFGYGVSWSNMPTMVKFLPHGERFGEVYALVSLGAGIGAVVIDVIVGHLYDMYVPAGQLLCVGYVCFYGGILVLLGISALGLVVSVWLTGLLWHDCKLEYAEGATSKDAVAI